MTGGKWGEYKATFRDGSIVGKRTFVRIAKSFVSSVEELQPIFISEFKFDMLSKIRYSRLSMKRLEIKHHFCFSSLDLSEVTLGISAGAVASHQLIVEQMTAVSVNLQETQQIQLCQEIHALSIANQLLCCCCLSSINYEGPCVILFYSEGDIHNIDAISSLHQLVKELIHFLVDVFPSESYVRTKLILSLSYLCFTTERMTKYYRWDFQAFAEVIKTSLLVKFALVSTPRAVANICGEVLKGLYTFRLDMEFLLNEYVGIESAEIGRKHRDGFILAGYQFSHLISAFTSYFESYSPRLFCYVLNFSVQLHTSFGDKRHIQLQAVKASVVSGNTKSCVHHASLLLTDMISADSSILNEEEVAYIADVLSNVQTYQEGNYEVAILNLRATISRFQELIKTSLYSETVVRLVDICIFLGIRIGQIYFDTGSPSRAASEFLNVYNLLSKSDSVNTTKNKVAVLSYLVFAHVEMQNMEVAKKIIATIKLLRSADPNFDLEGFTLSVHRGSCWEIYREKRRLPSTLPTFCISNHNADLGEIISRLYYHSKLYVSSLKSLTPTIIATELAVSVLSLPAKGLVELAKLYFFRGQIQFEAAKAGGRLRFPFVVGSSQLFDAVQSIYDSESFTIDNQFSEPNDSHEFVKSINFTLTCRVGRKYENPADLLWDSLNWFRRAWTLFSAVDDKVESVKTALMIANCHLEATFVPHILLHVPLIDAMDLGQVLQHEEVLLNSETEETKSDSKSSLKRRIISLEEVESTLQFAKSSVNTCSPLVLLTTNICLAEFLALRSRTEEAVWPISNLIFNLYERLILNYYFTPSVFELVQCSNFFP